MRCKHCHISATWSQFVYDSYRLMYPMLNSEKEWTLDVTYKGIKSTSVRPEKKCVASMFRVAMESIQFYGNEIMSPFNFDNYSLSIVKIGGRDSLKVGLTIMNDATMVREWVYFNARTRRLVLLSQPMDAGNRNNPRMENVRDPKMGTETGFIR
jgi:hypothetical protein